MALLEMDCFPVGMELFPAADTNQMDFIKKEIDNSDYYILIIGGRYGSVNKEGISFTEAEFDYALSKNIPILVFRHSNPDKIERGKSEIENIKAFNKFKAKACKDRLVKDWNNRDDLKYKIVIALKHSFECNPQTGYIRADALGKLHKYNTTHSLKASTGKKTNLRTKKSKEETRREWLSEDFSIRYTDDDSLKKKESVNPFLLNEIMNLRNGREKIESDHCDRIITMKWQDIYLTLGEDLRNSTDIRTITNRLSAFIENRTGLSKVYICSDDITAIMDKLNAMKLVGRVSKYNRNWIFRTIGERLYSELKIRDI